MPPPQVTKQSMQDANWVMPSYPTEDEHRISDALDKLGKGYEDAGNKPLGDCLHVIAAAFGMFLSPEHPQGPYVPQWEFGANRSAMLSDFDDSYLGVLEFALQTSKEPRARARLADILWLRKKHM